MNDSAFDQSAAVDCPASGLNRRRPDVFEEFRRVTIGRCAKELRTLLPSNCGVVCIAKLGSRFDKRLQHRLEIERRAADDLKHIGGGSLLLEGFA